MDFLELRSIVHIFSCIVDAKSPFTKAHSDGVARLARLIGNLFKLTEKSCEKLELAGLLHDIGKLRQPDALLEKIDKLTTEEYAHIQRHSFDTYAILKRIHGLEDIALWAAQHHERIDGSGYPYHLGEEGVSMEARIVAVADVFQALAQKRPYRDSLHPEEIMKILYEMASDGKLDHSIVKMVSQNLTSCWKAAMEEAAVSI
jgi:HD-GYP domain-containing protein (c-di-GMP phosphodiesterase class II)